MKTLKKKIRKLLYLISGRFNHLKIHQNISKKWYGNDYGGFFVFPDALNQNSIVYSFGIGEDISFDLDIIKHHKCKVFGFDPTPKSIQWVHSHQAQIPAHFNFVEYGIGNESGLVDFYLPKINEHVSGGIISHTNVDERHPIKVQIKSLADIALEMKHDRINVLKMDIEGAEYSVIESILKSPVKIDQILIEFHERFFADGKNKTINAIASLKTHGYRVFAISDTFDEVSFIREDIL